MNRYFMTLFIFLIGCSTKGTCSDSSIATWAGFLSPYNYPYYSIYNGTSWSTPLTIGNPGDHQTTSVVYTALNSINGQTMAVWANYPSNRPVYAIFSNGSWSTPSFLSADVSITSNDVYISFDPSRQIFLATWANTASSPGTPYYSIYSNEGWNAPAPITGSAGTTNNVTSSFNPNTGTIIVTWQEVGTAYPFYAIYSGTMSIGNAIETSTSANSNVFSTFDSATNTTIAVWTGNNSSNGYSSSYSGSWTAALSIPNASTEIEQDVTCSYNPSLQRVIATWVDGSHSHQVPLYSVYNGSPWTTDQEISASFLSSLNVFTSFNDTIQKTIAVTTDIGPQPVYSTYDGTNWSDLEYITADPTYAAYSTVYIGPTRLVNSPSNLSGIRKKNDFGILCEYYDTINWSLSNSSSVVAYNIYANGIKTAQVGPRTRQYQSHNKQKSNPIVYAVTAIDGAGNESYPITITIK